MTSDKAIVIKMFCENAYHQLKEKNGGDEVWVEMLKEYQYEVMLSAVKNYIKRGNTYPPSIADLINVYNSEVVTIYDDILNAMECDGVFNDPIGCDEEIETINIRHRREKSINWLQSNVMPDWFREILQKYLKKTVLIYGGGQKLLN